MRKLDHWAKLDPGVLQVCDRAKNKYDKAGLAQHNFEDVRQVLQVRPDLSV